MTPEPAHRRPGELIFSVVALVFSVSAFWIAYGISKFSGLTTPGVFPMLASTVMVISAMVIAVSAARKEPAPASEPGFFQDILPSNVVVLIALMLGYVVLMPLFGFVVSSALFLFLTFQFLWRKNPFLMLALTAVTLLAIYLIFREVFQVVLPQGTLMPRFF